MALRFLSAIQQTLAKGSCGSILPIGGRRLILTVKSGIQICRPVGMRSIE
jgi:hypothetical protein